MIYNNTAALQPPLFKTGVELSELCSTMIQSLVGGNISWDMNRQINFSLFCNRLITEMNIPSPVVYISLKYFQDILLAATTNNQLITHEYSLFTVSLLLAYKFHEDNPPFMNQWSFVSLLPIQELTMLELQVLDLLEFSLNMSTDQFYQWIEQCNTFYDMPYLLFDNHHHDSISVASSPLNNTSPILTPHQDWLSSPPPPLFPTCNDNNNYYYQHLILPQQDNSLLPPLIVDDFLLQPACMMTAANGDSIYPIVDCDNNSTTVPWLQMDHLWYLTQQPSF